MRQEVQGTEGKGLKGDKEGKKPGGEQGSLVKDSPRIRNSTQLGRHRFEPGPFLSGDNNEVGKAVGGPI